MMQSGAVSALAATAPFLFLGQILWHQITKSPPTFLPVKQKSLLPKHVG
jgi:hypothetical protein